MLNSGKFRQVMELSSLQKHPVAQLLLQAFRPLPSQAMVVLSLVAS